MTRRGRTVFCTLAGAVAVLAAGSALTGVASVAAAAAPAARPTVTAVSPPAGRTLGGNVVTVAGTGLDTATAVYFASAPASHLVHVSDTRLTVQVPAHHARTVHVRVLGPGGRSLELSADRYTYVGHAPEQTWTRAVTIDPSQYLNDVSCASARSCTAVDTGGAVLTYDGRHWSGRHVIDPKREVIRIDCPGVHFCMAVDGENGTDEKHTALREIDGRWLPTKTYLTGTDIGELSCSSRRLCVATNLAGFAFVYHDGTWGPKTKIDNNSLYGVSCADDRFCLAVDDAGREVVFNGTTWSAPRAVAADPDVDGELFGVSCVNRYYCVSGQNAVLVRRNGVWAPAGFNVGGEFGEFSCASVLFCSVVGINEDAPSPTLLFSGAAARHARRPAMGLYGRDGDYPAIDCAAPGRCVAVGGHQVSITHPLG